MSGKWRTIRVFISSTFRDMHAKRDYLVKVVFPELRERLEKHRVHLIDIDLRWGVTAEQADNDHALDLCLQQIDECRPFFVGILGERYGWVPNKIPHMDRPEYGWVQGMTGRSITELEIVHGVLNDHEMHSRAFFYFRDPSFVQDVPEPKRADLEAEDAEPSERLAELKAAIRKAKLPIEPFENYPCRYAGLRINWRLARIELGDAERAALEEIAEDGLVDPDKYAALDEHLREIVNRNSVVHLTGLEEFGRRVCDQLWTAIQTELALAETPLAETAAEVDQLAEERDYHERFMESRLRIYVGRENVQSYLTRFAKGGDTAPCLVTGPSGLGKSAAMAKFATTYAEQQPDVVIIPHFIGASPASTGLHRMLKRFCLILKMEFNFEDEVPEDTKTLITRFCEFLDKVPQGKRVLFVIDALNQMDETDNAHAMHWLPRELPPQVKVVISCIDDPDKTEQVLEAFKQRAHDSYKLEPLTGHERLEIVSQVPSLSAKALDPIQVGLLLSNPATENPLFLLVALEELRGFGSYEQLNDRIKAFPYEGETVTDIFTQVIERLEEDFDANMVRQVLSLLECSRGGLSERELQDLVAEKSRSEDLLPILRQLCPYLQSRGAFVDFFHRNLSKAVRNCYLQCDGTVEACHQQLASYFHDTLNPSEAPAWSGHSRHALSDLPHHLALGGQNDRLRATLLSFGFLESKISTLGPQPLIEDCDLTAADRNSALGLVQGAIRLSAHVLSNDPRQLAGHLIGRLLGDQTPEVGALLKAARPRAGCWLRPLTRSLTTPGGPLICTMEGHTSSVTAVALTADGHAVSASDDKTLKVWDLESGKLLRTLEVDVHDVNAVALTADGRAVSASGDHTLKVWDLESGHLVRTLEGHTESVCAVALTANGRAASASHDKTVKVWDIESGYVLHTLEGHTESVCAVALTADGRIVSASSDKTLKVWDIESGHVLRTLDGHKTAVTTMALSPDGRAVSAGLWDMTLKVWDIESGRLLRTLEGHESTAPPSSVTAVALTADGRAVSAFSRTLKVWDIESEQMLRTLENHTEGVCAVALANGRAVSASGDKTLKVWDIESGQVLRTLEGHTESVLGVALTMDGRAVSASRDKTLKVWDIESGQVLHTIVDPAHKRLAVPLVLEMEPDAYKGLAVALTPDGRAATFGSWDRTPKVWDVESGRLLRSLEGHTRFVDAVALTANGRAVSASQDGTLKVWDIESGRELTSFVGESAQACCAVSPDGALIVAGDWLGRVHLLRLEQTEQA